MRTIAKTTTPPDCLSQQPPNQDWYAFMQTECHGLVGDSLRAEQQHLCCYCEIEIYETGSHVEHLVPRSHAARSTYQYVNLAASCNGGDGTNRHCGHKKGGEFDAVRFSSPHDPVTCALFRYLPSGSGAVEPATGLSAQDHAKAEYLIELLNLGCPRLCGRRGAHARRLISTLGDIPSDEMVQWATDYYMTPDADGKLKAFVSVAKAVLDT